VTDREGKQTYPVCWRSISSPWLSPAFDSGLKRKHKQSDQGAQSDFAKAGRTGRLKIKIWVRKTGGRWPPQPCTWIQGCIGCQRLPCSSASHCHAVALHDRVQAAAGSVPATLSDARKRWPPWFFASCSEIPSAHLCRRRPRHGPI
jgi:hypothetical protein